MIIARTFQDALTQLDNMQLLESYKHFVAFEEWDKADLVQEEIYYRMNPRKDAVITITISERGE